MNERLARLLAEDEDMRVCYRAAMRGHFENLDEILACFGGQYDDGDAAGACPSPAEVEASHPAAGAVLRMSPPAPSPTFERLYAAYSAFVGGEPQSARETVTVSRAELDRLRVLARWDPDEEYLAFFGVRPGV